MKKGIVNCFAILFTLLGVDKALKVDRLTSLLTDEHNRQVIIHGANFVVKQFPYLPTRGDFNSNNSLVKQDFVNLKAWGFTSIRLHLAWQGFQPLPKQYNYTYLDELSKMVKQAANFGITIVLTVHQELYSRKFCGWGFPTWLGSSYNFPKPLKVQLRRDKQGIPLFEDCQKVSFQAYYKAYDVANFADEFYNNKNGMLDSFEEMWTKVAQYFTLETNIIAYDVLHQPSNPADWNSKATYRSFGRNNKVLWPFYRRIGKRIRQIDNSKLFFFEPDDLDFIHFYELPSEQPSADKLLLSWSQYCPLGKKLGQVNCNLLDFFFFRTHQQNTLDLQVGGLLGEFGNVASDTSGIAEINYVMRQAQANRIGWYYWQFKSNAGTSAFYYPNGELQKQKILALTAPYAYAICGTVVEQSNTKGSYSLTLIPSLCLNDATTELFLNEQLYFPSGFAVRFTPKCDNCKLRQISPSYYSLQVDQSALFKSLSVDVAAYMNDVQL